MFTLVTKSLDHDRFHCGGLFTLVPKYLNHDRFHCGGQFPSSPCSLWCPNPLIMIIPIVVASPFRPHVHFGAQIP